MRGMAAAIFVVAALMGCGGEPLSAKDERVVRAAAYALSVCADRFPVSERTPPRAARKHVDRLIAIYRKDPDAIENADHEEERGSMRDFLETEARNLTRDRCDPALARSIKDALGE